jgi:hypothetical protein
VLPGPQEASPSVEKKIALISIVADPDHFDADPDPTSEKNGCGSGSDHALQYIKCCNKIFLLKNGLLDLFMN